MSRSRRGYRRCAQCQRNRAERFYTSSKGRICYTCRKKKRRTYSRDQHLQTQYGLTNEEYAQLLEAQGGVCAICREPRTYNLPVDHCHKTGAIRGLPCKLCNGRLLTAARDNPEILRRAADYLENYPCDRVLGRRYVNEAPVKATADPDREALPETDG